MFPFAARLKREGSGFKAEDSLVLVKAAFIVWDGVIVYNKGDIGIITIKDYSGTMATRDFGCTLYKPVNLWTGNFKVVTDYLTNLV